jgi:hypothetical protein
MPPGTRFEYVRVDNEEEEEEEEVSDGVQAEMEQEDIVRFDIGEHVTSTIEEHSVPASPQKAHFTSPVARGLSGNQHSVSPQKKLRASIHSLQTLLMPTHAWCVTSPC